MQFFTTSNLDLTSAPMVQRVKGWHISAGAAASTVVLRNGGVGGAIIVEIKVPAGTSVHFQGDSPLVFNQGVFVVPDANVSRGVLIPG